MTAAGQRNARVTFQRNTGGRSAMGGAAPESWTALGTRWGKPSYGSGAERRSAAGEQAVQAVTVRVLADTLTRSVTHKDRLSFDGLVWDITSIVPIGGAAPTYLDFTAMASRD